MTEDAKAEALRLVEQTQLDTPIGAPLTRDQIEGMYHFTLDELVRFVELARAPQTGRERDAKRYRWLRSQSLTDEDPPKELWDRLDEATCDADVDAAIDAAIAAAPSPITGGSVGIASDAD